MFLGMEMQSVLQCYNTNDRKAISSPNSRKKAGPVIKG